MESQTQTPPAGMPLDLELQYWGIVSALGEASTSGPKAEPPVTGLKARTDGLTDGLASKHMTAYQQKHRIKILKRHQKSLLICGPKCSICQRHTKS